jgi:hypothetical protein
MAQKPVTTFKVGRDAGTGQFKPVEQARRDKQGSVVETIKVPVHSTGNKKK